MSPRSGRGAGAPVRPKRSGGRLTHALNRVYWSRKARRHLFVSTLDGSPTAALCGDMAGELKASNYPSCEACQSVIERMAKGRTCYWTMP